MGRENDEEERPKNQEEKKMERIRHEEEERDMNKKEESQGRERCRRRSLKTRNSYYREKTMKREMSL